MKSNEIKNTKPTAKSVRQIVGPLATVRTLTQNASKVIQISFHKNWGHDGILAALRENGFAVQSGHFGNEYEITLNP